MLAVASVLQSCAADALKHRKVWEYEGPESLDIDGPVPK